MNLHRGNGDNMNIELANRLKIFRQNAGLSQEELAVKLNISRQAVSKWERGEASPDIENLVVLSRLYNVTVDELLTGESSQDGKDERKNSGESRDERQNEKNEQTCENGEPQGEYENTESCEDEQPEQSTSKKDYVHINPFDGIHVHTVDGDHVDISFKDGVRVHSKDGDDVDISASGVHVNNDDWKDHIFTRGKDKRHFLYKFPYAILIVILFFAFGLFLEAWHPAWLVFLTIPIYYSAVDAAVKKNAYLFAYPVLAVLIYLVAGFFFAAWHPMWIVFLTIPLYYSLVNYHRRIHGKAKNDDEQY